MDMKPFAALKYYRQNKKRLLLLFLPVMLCVVMLFLIQTVIASSFQLEYRAFVETRKVYTSIEARGNPIDLEIISGIRANENTERLAPCIMAFTEMTSLLDRIGVRIYLLGEEDLTRLLSDMNLILIAGRLPVPGEQEIILHETVAINKGLAIGDQIGNNLDPAEKLLGLYTVVGLVRGQALCGFAPLETWQDRNQIEQPEEYGLLIFPKPGRLADLNRFIEYLPLTGNEISSYNTSLTGMNESASRVYLLLNIIFIAMLLITSLCVGFLSYLFYLGRSREFAILHVIGYGKTEIIKRNLLDVFLINLLATLAALLVSILVCFLLNQLALLRLGMPLTLADSRIWLLVLCVPLAAMVAEVLAVSHVFQTLDPVSLLDQEN